MSLSRKEKILTAIFTALSVASLGAGITSVHFALKFARSRDRTDGRKSLILGLLGGLLIAASLGGGLFTLRYLGKKSENFDKLLRRVVSFD